MPDFHHLPGWVPSPGEAAHRGRTAAGAPFTVPSLDAAAADAVADAVRDAALEARRAFSVREVVSIVARAAGRLGDPDCETGSRARSLLAREQGWPEPLAGETLRSMARIWTRDALLDTLEGELGDPALLDGFGSAGPLRSDDAGEGSRGTRRRRAVGPPLLFVVNAGNVPGVAVTAALRGLCVRSGVLLKTPEEEPGLLPLFARAVEEESELLGRTLAVTWWPGDSGAPTWDRWTKRSGKVVVYGGESAIRAVRNRLPPTVEMVGYGPRIGLGVLLPDAGRGDAGTAEAVARDVCAYEQRGCVSPRVLYLPGSEDPVPFAEEVAGALRERLADFPPAPPTEEEAMRIRAVRARAELGERDGEDGVRVLSPGDDDLSWTVLAGGPAPPRSEGLPRVLRVRTVPDLAGLESLLAPLEGRIQAMGYAGTQGRRRLAEMAVRLGVARMAPFGSVAWPPADWRHDGRFQLLPLLRWTDWELP